MTANERHDKVLQICEELRKKIKHNLSYDCHKDRSVMELEYEEDANEAKRILEDEYNIKGIELYPEYLMFGVVRKWIVAFSLKED